MGAVGHRGDGDGANGRNRMKIPQDSEKTGENFREKGIAKGSGMCYNAPCVQSPGILYNIGMSPSGKAPDFDSGIRRFKSGHPSHI